MKQNQIMTPEEIHKFGIEVVFNQLRNDAYEIQTVNTRLGTHPQIIAKKDNVLAFIAVRTACYPDKGMLENSVHFLMIEHVAENNAIPYFASVGIANAHGDTEEDMGIPIKGAGFHVAYEGMLIIAHSDQVEILDD